MIVDLLEERGATMTLASLSKFWDDLYQSLTERSDFKVQSERIISFLSVDLCLFLSEYCIFYSSHLLHFNSEVSHLFTLCFSHLSNGSIYF